MIQADPKKVLIFLGGMLVLYAFWALYSGSVISTRAQLAYRPSIIYWLTVGALAAIGGINVLLGAGRFYRDL